MNQTWSALRSTFEDRSRSFADAAHALRSAPPESPLEAEARDDYLIHRRNLQQAIENVVGFVPATLDEAEARRSVAAAVLILCHEHEEVWLESEAGRISPLPGFPDR